MHLPAKLVDGDLLLFHTVGALEHLTGSFLQITRMTDSKSKAPKNERLKHLRVDEAIALADQVRSTLQQRLEQSELASQSRQLAELVATAKGGDVAQLQAWLLEHGHLDTSQVSTVDQNTGEVAEISSWNSLLPFAKKRLADFQARSTGLQTGGQPSAKQLEAHDHLLAELSKPLPEASDTTDSWRKRVFGSRIGGAVSSLVVHLLLLFALGFVTLKLPGPPAGMALQSAPSSERLETVSLLEPVESSEITAEPADFEPVSVPEVPEQLSEVAVNAPALERLEVDTGTTNAASRAAQLVAAAAVAASSDASFFGAAATGNCFCYVIDGSGSMRGGPWQAAKFELLKSLGSLKPQQRFYIIFFNRKLSAITDPGQNQPASHALYATEENLKHARRWLDTLEIGIGAPPSKALELAISKEPDAIYLLTDGVTKVDVPKVLRESNRVFDLINGEQVLVPIHAIAFYSLDGQALLKRVAAENRGQFIYVPDPSKK